jgi:hypothetical protein
MSRIDGQVHNKFKLFGGTLDGDGSIATLAGQAAKWAGGANVAPKSIGVEYLESSKRVVLSIGYRDDEPGYAIKLHTVPITRIGKLDDPDVTRIEREMEKACTKLQRIICHELYVTETGDLTMVFMTHEA